jgi:sugar phosphate isomerase/epimerase
MRLGVFAVLFSDKPLPEVLDYLVEQRLNAVEIGVGGYPGDAHCKVDELLEDPKKRDDYLNLFKERDIKISALSVHGNPLHPIEERAKKDHESFVKTVKLASLLGVESVITFSGCPGESEHSRNPVWNTCAWPPEYAEVLRWQWEEKVIPYWKEQNKLAEEHGVRIAIEPHPGFVVYNNETMLKLRESCGEAIGANFDPSHYFWQGMDPVEGIKELGQANALFHFHAKDTQMDARNTALNGVLDTKSYTHLQARSWTFRTVGYGHNETTWRDIISALQLIGYDGAISIEHEDPLMSPVEGFEKAVAFLQTLLIKEQPGDMYWA